jgi:ABC-2 type transport system permease protein
MSQATSQAGTMSIGRYFRLYGSFVRYCLVRELGFRFNFLARAITGVAWLILIVFYFDLIFGNTRSIGGWTKPEYFFLMGTWFILYGIIEALFLENCTRFSELIRTGNLDFMLLKPVDAQFLASFERIDWAELPGAFFGAGLLIYSVMTGSSDHAVPHVRISRSVDLRGVHSL